MYAVDGMWWKPEAGVNGFVSLSNTTAEPVKVRVQMSDEENTQLEEETVSVSPHGTKIVALHALEQAVVGASGGLRVLHSGTTEGLLISAGMEDTSTGYSAAIPFHYTLTPASTSTGPEDYAELGLMTGTADPMMQFPANTVFTPFTVARNVSDQPVSVTPTLYWMEAGKSRLAKLPAVSLLPYQSRMLDIAPLLAKSGLSAFNGSFNLILDAQGQPGSLLLASGSVDQRNTYVFQVLPHRIIDSNAKTISYWSTGNGDDTMVTIWNPADETQDFLFTLYFGGGHYRLPIHLEPRATRTFNISEVIQNQIPDAEGNLIPPSVHEGSARITGIHADNEEILVAVDAGTYNVRKATCNYYCISCDGSVQAFVVVSPFTVSTARMNALTFTLKYNTGYEYTWGGTWGSSNTSIATVGNSSGFVTGVSHGSVSMYANTYYADVYNSNYCNYEPFSCPYVAPQSAGGTGTVTDNTPILTGIDPSDWPSGKTTPSVAFSGQYFGTNPPTLTFSPSAGIGYSLVSYNDTQIVANITVASGTPTEDVEVSVTNNGYGGLGFQSGGGTISATSAPVYATVRAPLNSPEITIIAWVNGNAPDLKTLPTGENSTLKGNLQNGTSSQQAACAVQVGEWVLGIAANIATNADRAYANAWLLVNSANTAPPSTITPSAQLKGGNYRLFNDFGGSGQPLGTNVGYTPDPCKTGLLDWAGAGEPSQYEGYSSTSPAGQVYQIAEGRIGRAGQAGSETINGRTVPWIWSAIEFNSANGTPNYNPPLGTFPTYYLYVNGTLTYTFAQSTVAAFIAHDRTYQLTPSQIP